MNFKEKINKIQLDHCFIDEENKIIYISELKSNLNLDSEKSKATCNKLNEIKKYFEINFSKYTIHIYLVNLRFLDKKLIDNKILSKFNNINVIGLNEYFKKLNVKITFTEKEYKEFLNQIINFINNS